MDRRVTSSIWGTLPQEIRGRILAAEIPKDLSRILAAEI